MSQISSLDPPSLRPMAAARGSAGADGELAVSRGQTVDGPAPGRMRVGPFSLRQIVAAAVAQAEGEAIRRVLGAERGDKRRAAGVLSISYSTLLAKMKRYGISPPAFPR
jgi:DNA-binding NtrC family response regulator